MAMPYQCLERCGNVLVAASGSRIDTFKLEDGSLISTWKCPVDVAPKTSKDLPQEEIPPKQEVPAKSPPAKRRKLAGGAEEQEQTNESTGEKKANNRLDAVASGLEAPAVIAMTCTNSGNHVVAVTGEDKSVRVFEHDGAGYLQQISQRYGRMHLLV